MPAVRDVKMFDYEIIPQSQANPAEQVLLEQLWAFSREFAKADFARSGILRCDVDVARCAQFVAQTPLDDVRPAFANTMMDLAQSHTNSERWRVSAFASLVGDYESQLWACVLVDLESEICVSCSGTGCKGDDDCGNCEGLGTLR